MYRRKKCEQTCDPGHVRRVGPGQPIRGHAVVQPERVQADLEGAEVQVAVRPCVVVVRRRLQEIHHRNKKPFGFQTYRNYPRKDIFFAQKCLQK